MTSPRAVYSVVVPVYNSVESIRTLVGEIRAVMQEVGEPYEVILVDDGSTVPATWPTLQTLANGFPEVMAARLGKNFGRAAAVVCGMSLSNGDWVVTIDDDLQQSPRDIPKLLEKKEHEVVVGHYEKDLRSIVLRCTSAIKGYFDRTILNVPVKQGPFNLIHRRVVNLMVENASAHLFIPALMASATNDFMSVKISFHPSQHGKSRYNLLRRIRQFLNLIIGNSSFMLRMMGYLGMIVALSGFAYAAYLIAVTLLGGQIAAGFPSLMVTQLILSGMILFTLAIVGEYLIRILDNTSRKRSYVIREIAGEKKTTDGAKPVTLPHESRLREPVREPK